MPNILIMQKKIKIWTVILILFHLSIFQSKGNDSTTFKLNWGGFIKNDFFVDTRKNLEAVDGQFLFYPLAPNYDSNGNDLNDKYSANIISLAARLGLSASGVRFLNANASGHVEFDFTNFTTIAGVRFRHAYSKLDWKNSSLLFGLYWHPLFTIDVFPTVMSLNTGAPFQVFNRSPQIRYSQKIADFRLIASAVYQADYKSIGPSGASSEYLKNAILPNLNLILQYEGSNWLMGVTGDYKIIQPRLFIKPLTGPNTDDIYKTDEKIESYAANLFLRYRDGNLTVKTKAMIGQNLYEHLLPGGYALSSLDSLTGKATYTPYNHLFLWANILYGKRIQAGIFTGYFKNLGTSDHVLGTVYARGENIEYAYRISPHISYNEPKISVSLEVETNVAAYGEIDFENKARIINSKETVGTRFMFSVSYFF